MPVCGRSFSLQSKERGDNIKDIKFKELNGQKEIYLNSAYNGQVKVPVTYSNGKTLLACELKYGDKKIQFIVLDGRNKYPSQLEQNPRDIINAINNDKYDIVNVGKVGKNNFDIKTYINAYYCIIKYHKFLYEKLNRVGVINDSVVMVSLVNVNFTNAYWSGLHMVYGNSSDSNATALTTMDICSHELTHGLTEFTCNLEYRNESGALNEALSDIFGTYMEFYENSIEDEPDYTMGEESNMVIRNMANPKEYNQPWNYKGEYWHNYNIDPRDNGGVHINSGVINFLIYILINGINYTNDFDKQVKLNKKYTYAEVIQVVYNIMLKVNSTCDFTEFTQNLIDVDINNKKYVEAVGILVPSSPSSPSKEGEGKEGEGKEMYVLEYIGKYKVTSKLLSIIYDFYEGEIPFDSQEGVQMDTDVDDTISYIIIGNHGFYLPRGKKSYKIIAPKSTLIRFRTTDPLATLYLFPI